MIASAQLEKPRVYSYIRFSTPEQKLGDSLRRQIERARDFAQRKGLEFDEQLKDEGLSGYHGANRKRGALGRFLARVKRKEIPKGSFLVVEKISRLGREDVFTSLKTILNDLIENGVILQTLAPEETYDRESLNGPQFIALWLFIQNAHRESAEKSDFTAKTNEGKRARLKTGEKMGANCPSWLLPIRKDGKVIAFEARPKARETIKEIFKLKLSGIGKTLIAQRLNAGDYWRPHDRKRRRGGEGNPAMLGRPLRWRESYIDKILSNPAVRGFYQPHIVSKAGRIAVGEAIAGYYPSMVSEADFCRVQELSKRNRGRKLGGRPNGERNLFVYLAVCAYCGAPMTYQPKSNDRGSVSYTCSAGRVGSGCGKGHSVSYNELQDTVLENCSKLSPELLLPSQDLHEKEHKKVHDEILTCNSEHSRLTAERTNLFNQIAQTTRQQFRAEYERQIELRDRKLSGLEDRLVELRKALAKAEASPRRLEEWRTNIEKLKAVVHENSREAAEMRGALKYQLAELIEKIEVFGVGYKSAYDPDHQQQRVRARTLPRGKWKRLRKEDVEAMRKDYKQSARTHLQKSDDIGEYLSEVLSDSGPRHHLAKPVGRFIADSLAVRMSKRGRFYRVFFQTGVTIDLAPQASIADRMVFVAGNGSRRGVWQFERPSTEVLRRSIELGKRAQAWKRRMRRKS